MGFHLSCVEQCSKLRQCRQRNCLLKFHPSGRANRRLSETTLPWPHGPCCPPSLAGSADFLVFRLVARGNTLVRPYTVVVVELARAIGQVLKILETDRVGLRLFERLPFLSPRRPGEEAGLLLRCSVAAATTGSEPLRNNHMRSACLTMAGTVV